MRIRHWLQTGIDWRVTKMVPLMKCFCGQNDRRVSQAEHGDAFLGRCSSTGKLSHR